MNTLHQPLRSMCDATPGMCMHDWQCNQHCPGKPSRYSEIGKGADKTREKFERELLRACHLSGQMTADQSVQHYRANELDAKPSRKHGAILVAAGIFGAIAAAALLWPVVSYFFK